MKRLILVLLLFAATAQAQNNLFYTPDNSRSMPMPSIGRDFVQANSEYLSMTDANYGTYSTSIFAVSVWVKPIDVTSVTIISQESTLDMAFEIGIDASSHPYCSYTNDGVSATATTLAWDNSALVSKTWYHIYCVWDGTLTQTARMKIYVNGTAETTTASPAYTTLRATAQDITMGKGGLIVTGYFDGMMYQPCVYSGSYPTAALIYSGGNGTSCPNVGLYSTLRGGLGDAVGGESVRATAWTDNATVNLARRASPTTIQLPDVAMDATANATGALMSSANFGAESATIKAVSGWIYPTSLLSTGLLNQNQTNGNRSWSFLLNGTTQAAGISGSDDGITSVNVTCTNGGPDSDGTMKVNTWTHYYGVIDLTQADANKFRIWLDGVQCTTTGTITITSLFTNASNIRIGAVNADNAALFVGYLYNICFYSGGYPNISQLYGALGQALPCPTANLWASPQKVSWRSNTADAKITAADWTYDASWGTTSTMPTRY